MEQEAQEKQQQALNELYYPYRDRLLDLQKASSEDFDKWILTLSSGALGLSLTFIKNVVGDITQASYLWLLVLSWLLFALCISITVSSFLVSQYSLSVQLNNAEKVFVERDETYRDKNRWANLTVWLNRFSGICFIAAVLVTVVFASLNVCKEGNPMATGRLPGQPVPPMPKPPMLDTPGQVKPGSGHLTPQMPTLPPPTTPSQPPPQQPAKNPKK